MQFPNLHCYTQSIGFSEEEGRKIRAALLPHSKKLLGLIPSQIKAFLCGVDMFLACLRGRAPTECFSFPPTVQGRSDRPNQRKLTVATNQSPSKAGL